MAGFRLGGLGTIEEIRIALRDIEKEIITIEQQAAMTLDDTPANPQVLVKTDAGEWEIWDIVSTGGCTITKDAGTKQIRISVP